ncbi:hypothetical protein Tmath_1977 [Thermoanaerobacter mathranii subsp. mathranii str. A3]|uniref:Uncharacterized protein n=1 Tax=Thermoanaerobacter mathranii subsp. mathranii (strain DSM 11426 / CCUG 53645 / CIP 108742 / A3) TaxID=583358 RepID=A0ABM5LSB3_THEM3|nr:hypothetical protein Tmath_1977 [Thermoanaerobacter mathranii subsp. mathranii str. A3]
MLIIEEAKYHIPVGGEPNFVCGCFVSPVRIIF